jgi:hypothetical protein
MKHKVTCRAKRTTTVQNGLKGKTQELIKKKENPTGGMDVCLL